MARKRKQPVKVEVKTLSLLESEEERARQAKSRRVFYHPDFGSNGVAAGGGVFQPVAAPKGYEFDVEQWKRDGADGPAKLRRVSPLNVLIDEDAQEEPEEDESPQESDPEGPIISTG